MAASAALLQTTEFSGSRSVLADRLEQARSKIEARFLEGGAALLSILDVLNKLIGSLDQATGSLDGEAADATMAELQQTVSRLSGLSGLETDRQARFREIAVGQRLLKPHIDEMQETLRYLRTFAVTAKIAGAGIADFAGFAEEILERIQFGTRQVTELAEKLQTVGKGLGPVMAKGETIIRSYEQTIPQIVTGLVGGGAEIGRHREMLVKRADEVRRIARGIQSKLATTLSAMQIGDITRQRIEHCQSSLSLLDDYLVSPQATGLTAVQRDSLASVIGELVSLQLTQSIDDFDRDTGKIVTTVASFRSDLAQIDALRRAMTDGDGDESDGAMRRLEAGVGAARHAVRDVEAVAGEAAKLSRTTAQTVGELVAGIGTVQLVRTDIHYMALNTNLRCGKIGDEGKAINVVTSELRNYAAKLDEAADKILVELQGLDAATGKLCAMDGEGDEASLDSRLENAMTRIRAVGDRMEEEMTLVADQSRAAIGEMDASLRRLDFQAELGEVLRACAEESLGYAGADLEPGLEAAFADLGSRIAKLYTMVSEREVHARVMGVAPPAETAAVATVLSDDDIEDALF